MIYENIESFLESLIHLTKEKKMHWNKLTSFTNYNEFLTELETCSDIDFVMNSIHRQKSYYLKHKDGYVFLLYIYHGDPDVTSPMLDSLALMIKANSVVPVYNLTSNMQSREHQRRLETLKLLIEHYLEEKYSMPETLYKFMNEVLSDADNKIYDFGNEESN